MEMVSNEDIFFQKKLGQLDLLASIGSLKRIECTANRTICGVKQKYLFVESCVAGNQLPLKTLNTTLKIFKVTKVTNFSFRSIVSVLKQYIVC